MNHAVLSLLALPLSGCLSIPDAENLRRIHEAATIGTYAGSFTVTYSKDVGFKVASVQCAGEVSFEVSGEVSGEPLDLGGLAACTSEGEGDDELNLGTITLAGDLVGEVDDGVIAGTFDGVKQDNGEVHLSWDGEVDFGEPRMISGWYSTVTEIGVVRDIQVEGAISAEQVSGL